MAKTTAYLFPGQGAQLVGMAKDFYESESVAKQLFDKTDEIVGYKLSVLCFEGPEDKLNSTTVSQPAIFTVSAAILEVLREKNLIDSADVTAGLSLGEYTALYAAGVLSFEDGLKLVQKRGQAMQTAADNSKGSMVSIMGLDEEKVTQLCGEAGQGQLLSCANFNCPGQIVITGEIEPCKRALALAEKYGAIKAIELKVAGAFHSELMAPAADELKTALDSADIKPIDSIDVISNVTADYYKDPAQISDGLVSQLTSPVLWQKCMERLLSDGVEKFYEIGPNRVLTGLMRRINRKTKVINISTTDSIDKLS